MMLEKFAYLNIFHYVNMKPYVIKKTCLKGKKWYAYSCQKFYISVKKSTISILIYNSKAAMLL